MTIICKQCNKSFKIRITRQWEDLDWIMFIGDIITVYDAMPNGDFYFTGHDGSGYQIPKDHCVKI